MVGRKESLLEDKRDKIFEVPVKGWNLILVRKNYFDTRCQSQTLSVVSVWVIGLNMADLKVHIITPILNKANIIH